MITDAPAEAALRRLPYERLRGFSDLFVQYCSDYEPVADFFAGPYADPAARQAAAARAAAHPRDRDALADLLLDQNARWGLDEQTKAHIEALRDPASAAVVTGQQVGLFGGPLYTPYKTITAVQLARQMQAEAGRPVVPVFWLEGEDHDFAEVASTMLMRGNEAVPIRYAGPTMPAKGNAGPVGRLVLSEDVEEALAEADAALRPSDFKEALMARLRAAYQPGTTLLDAFARFLRSLFPEAGLIFIDPGDARLKRLGAPLFRREIEDYAAAAEGLQAASGRLEAAFHVQVRTQPLNLFLLHDGGRYALKAAGEGFALRGTDRTFSRAELLALLETEPERFSPNVVLRPVLQDLLLPTAAYVAGPGEVSYFAQFRPVYEWANVPMPIVYPRASVTLVEAKVQKVLDRYGLTLADLDEDLEALFQRLIVAEMEVDLDDTFAAAGRHVHEAVNGLKEVVEKVDRTLVSSAEALRAALMKEMEKFKGRVVKAEKRSQDEVRGQLEKAYTNLVPGGKLQERSLSALYFLNKYGPDLFKDLEKRLSLDTTAHQVLAL